MSVKTQKLFTPLQVDQLQAIGSFTGSLSLVGLCFAFRKMWIERHVNRSLAARLVFWLLLMDFVDAMVYAVGHRAFLMPNFCTFQGFVIQWQGVAIQMWTTFIIWNMYQWIVKKKNAEKLSRKIPLWLTLISIGSAVPAFALIGKYGSTQIWCWVPKTYDVSRFFSFYVPLIIFISLNSLGITYIITAMRFFADKEKLGVSKNSAMVVAEASIRRKLESYVFIFIVCWGFGLLNRTVEMITSALFYPTMVLMVIFLPIQGFFNSLVYLGFGGYLVNKCLRAAGAPEAKRQVFRVIASSSKRNSIKLAQLKSPAALTTRNSSEIKHLSSFDGGSNQAKRISTFESGFGANPLIAAGAVIPEGPLRSSVSPSTNSSTSSPCVLFSDFLEYRPKEYSIFVTTLNFGEAKASAIKKNLADWILPGHDIYSIGVQECLDKDVVREIIWDHLGGPTEYCKFSTEIGSDNTRLGYHGFIALTVFVRASEVLKGNIRQTTTSASTQATGANLGLVKAANKGAVGIPFQIHDTSIAFLTSHLPSDQKGTSKLKKRNDSASSIFKEVVLAPEDVSFDMYFQHDHVFFSGDLNYRMGTLGFMSNTFEEIANAASIEKEILGNDPRWLERKYNLLRSMVNDPAFPDEEEVKLLEKAQDEANEAWFVVLQSDELRACIESGLAFSNFHEPQPCFPPTYKRRLNELGHCGDYTDPAIIVKGFSNTGDENMPPKSSATDSFATTARGTMSSPGDETPANHEVDEEEGGVEDGEEVGGGGLEDYQQKMVQEQVAKNQEAVVEIQDKIPKRVSTTNVPLTSTNLSSFAKRMSTGWTVAENADTRKTSAKSVAFSDTGGGGKGRPASGGSREDEDEKTKKKKKKALRPPSYTDRILIHSLHDRKDKLEVQAYNFCDEMRVSDHRAVTLVSRLTVNGCIKFSPNFSESQGEEYGSIAEKGNAGGGTTNSSHSSTKDPFRPAATAELGGAAGGEPTKPGLGVANGKNDSLQRAAADSETAEVGNSESLFLFELTVTQLEVVLKSIEGDGEIEVDDIANPLQSRGLDKVEDGTAAAGGDHGDKHTSRKESHAQSITQALNKKKKKGGMFGWLKRCFGDDEDEDQNTKVVSALDVVFPLPSKDPLLKQRKIFIMTQAFQGSSNDALFGLTEIAKDESKKYHLAQKDRAGEEHLHTSHESIMKPSSSFTWSGSPRPSSSNTFMREEGTQDCADFRVIGCLVPELGAHVMIKFVNAAGRNLGECVIALTHLISAPNGKKELSATIKGIPVTLGGQARGTAKGHFTLTFLAQSSLEEEDTTRLSVALSRTRRALS